MESLSPFPPSFDGNPWTYGFALFSLTLVSSMSLAQLLTYWFETRRLQEVDRQIGNLAPHPEPLTGLSTLTAFRQIVAGFLLMAFLGTTPDVFILLAWGETSQRTMEILYLVDRLGDGLLMFPFLHSLWLLSRVRQALPQQLAKVIHVPLGPFRWAMLKDNAKIFMVTLTIAVGVTLGKAGA